MALKINLNKIKETADIMNKNMRDIDASISTVEVLLNVAEVDSNAGYLKELSTYHKQNVQVASEVRSLVRKTTRTLVDYCDEQIKKANRI